MPNTLKLVALHKHWCIADAVRVVVGADVLKPDQEEKAVKKYGADFLSAGQQGSLMSRLTVWYSLLYVVVEGYRELKTPFAPLDAVLSNGQYADLLRLFRNATFHYQEDPFSEKLLGFLTEKDSERWIRELNKQLEAFFFQVLPIRETIERIQSGTFDNQVFSSGTPRK